MESTGHLCDVKNQRGYLEYVKEIVQNHSPASQRLVDLAIRQYEMAFENASKGEKYIWTTLKCVPLLYSAGVKPLMLADIVRYGETELIPKAERFFQIPSEICTMIKAEYGTLYQYRNENIKKIVVSPYLQCEPTVIASATMKKYGYEVYMADLVARPKNMQKFREEAYFENMKNEYIKIYRWLCEKDIDKDLLKEELSRANRIKSKVSYLEKLQKQHNLYLKTVLAMLVRCGVETYYAQPVLFEEILDELIAEMETLEEGTFHDETLPNLIWSGARGVDFSAFLALDQVGGHVCYWNLVCNLEKRYDLTIDSLEALLKYDYDISETSSISELCDTDERYKRENQADGIILFQTQGCTYNSIEFELRRKEFANRNIPVLLLTGNTQTGEINGQTLIRLEAFIEMLRKR